MLAPVLLVFMAAADADGAQGAAVIEAATRALGRDVRVVLRRYQNFAPTDQDLQRAAHEEGLRAVARVSWKAPDRSRAAIDVYLAPDDRTLHRALDFQAQDQPAERGRAVGLVLAALVMAPPTRAETASAPRVPDATPGVPPAPPGPWALEGFAHGGVPLGGVAAGLGGGLAGRRYSAGGWGSRLGIHARVGSVPEAQASSLAVGLGAGLFYPLGPAEATWTLAARAEGMLLYEALTHFSSDDPEPVHRGRLVPGAALLLEGQWRIAPAAALHLAAGLEAAFGTTRIVVRGIDVARLSPVRGVLEAGIRTRF